MLVAEAKGPVEPIPAEQCDLYPRMLVERILPIAQSEATEVRVLARWAKDLLSDVEELCVAWQRGEFALCRRALERLERETVELAGFRRSWSPNSDGTGTTTGAAYVPSSVALEEIQLALERRMILWQKALSVESGPSHPLAGHFGKGVDDLRRLTDLTRDVEAFFMDANTLSASGEQIGRHWCDYFDTSSFLIELEACRKTILQPTRRVSTLVSTIPIPMLASFCDRANVATARLEDDELSKSQRAYLGAPVLTAWKEELQNWTADTVSTRHFLKTLERFEEQAGMSDMERLFRTATRLSFSRTPSYRGLGLMTLDVYGGSNVKLYVSKVLVNHLLPPTESEVASFREVIQGQPVVGRRQADLDIEMNFIPDPERLLLSLDLKGSISTQSQASAFATTLFNRGQADCVARKRLELTEEGFILSPTQVRVEKNRIQLRNIQTEFDGVPLVSNLFRGVVRNQYEARQFGAKEETRRKIAGQIKARVDKEADGRFTTFNERFREFMATSMHEFDLYLEKKHAGTEEDWLLTSWAIRSQNSLSGHTPAPDTQPGAFADLKIHESALNAVLGKLGLEGRTATVAELREMIARRFRRPALDQPGENDDVEIGFAAYNPLSIRFADGRIDLSIGIDSLRLNRQTHRDFRVLVRYRPELNDEGKLVLRRDGVISLVGTKTPLNMRTQIAMRAVFGKIFPENRPFPLTPKVLDADERFESLTTGQCRIEKGWFALALVARKPPEDKELVSEKPPVRRATR